MKFNTVVARTSSVMSLVLAAGLCIGAEKAEETKSGSAPAARVDAYPTKPAKTMFNPVIHQSDVIIVRFNKGLTIRERGGVLTDLETGVLNDPAVAATLANYAWKDARNAPAQVNAAAGPKTGAWERLHEVDEAKLAQMCANAEKNLGHPVADLNLEFFLHLPAGADVGKACDDFNALGIVEMAEPHHREVAMPVGPDIRIRQKYGSCENAYNGTCAYGAWAQLGGIGDVRICDVEYGFNTGHADLPPIQVVRGPLVAAPGDATNEHGTAVLGEIAAKNDNQGTVGMATGCTILFASEGSGSSFNPASAISTAAANLSQGEVMLLEMQTSGPNYTGQPSGTQFGLVPSEWVRSTYNAIVVAVGNGINVVEAGGNGSQNLDAAIYSQGNGGHYPFLAGNDSGAIIVGAGSSGYSGATPRLHLGFSSYGSRVNLQGWGESVTTLGYGDLYQAEGENLFYTAAFSGTSSASPIVASAVAVIESVYKNAWGFVAGPGYLRSTMIQQGRAQPAADAAATHIGPLPDVLHTLHVMLPPPANDACASAVVLPGRDYAVLGSTLGAHPTQGIVPTCGDSSGSADVWYRFTAPFDGALAATTCGTNDFAIPDGGINTTVGIFDGGCGGPELACSDDTNVYFCGDDSGIIRDANATAVLHGGQTVYIRVSTPTSAQPGPFILATKYYGAHDTCENAMDVTNITTVRASLEGMTPTPGLVQCAGVANAPDAWHKFTACTDGQVRFSTCGTNDLYSVDHGMDTVLSVYDSCGSDATLLACNDDALPQNRCLADSGAGRDSNIDMAVQSGHTYYIRVADYYGRPNMEYILNTYFVIANDTCRNATLLDEGTITYNTSCATDDGYREYYCSGGPTYGKDLWFEFFPVIYGPVDIDTCGSLYDTKLAVYGSCWDSDNAPSLLACNDDFCGLGSHVQIAASQYQLLYIRVGGYNGASGPGVLTISGGREHCPADFNRDGGVDGADVGAFFAAWESGDATADVNRDGGVDGGDVQSFFAAWEAGGC